MSAMGESAGNRRHGNHKVPLYLRVPATLLVLTTPAVAALFLLVAWIVSVNNCEDGCATGSRWAPGAWGAVVQLWGLALPAFLAGCVFAWAVLTRRERTSVVAWTATVGLLVLWCVFTGTSSTDISLSGTNSHWMWLAGLMLAAVGGLAGFFSFFGLRYGRQGP